MDGSPEPSEDAWGERAGRLYVELERPARAMVRRAFRGAFSDDELDDIYAGAWVGTLRTLGRRHAELSDEQIRKYLLAAVANQASKELRRRRRKPTAPLELVDAVADDAGLPDEKAVGAERSRIARDLLVSLPPRRRAVMLLRFGWGLEPRQVCELVKLSPRAYRKEVTRGVDELTEQMRLHERGDWCAEREAVLKAFAAGLADAEERRQAEAHLAHCRDCAGLVARLRGRLHDLGAGLALPAAIDVLHGKGSLVGWIGELGERGRDALGGVLSRGAEAQETIGGIAASGGTRGAASAAGSGILAKLAGLGTAGKVAAVCLTGGAAATACVGAGVLPGLGAADGGERERSGPREPGRTAATPDGVLATETLSEGSDVEPDAPSDEGAKNQSDEEDESRHRRPQPAIPAAPPVHREFGLAAADGPEPTSGDGAAGAADAGGGGAVDGGRSASGREFGAP